MEELDLKEVLKMFWNRKFRIILIVILFVIVGMIYSIFFVTPMYSSSTTLVLATNLTSKDSSITATDLNVNSKLISTYSELVKSKNVLRTVIDNLNIDIKEDELRKNIDVSSVKNTELIEITVTNADKYYARKIANEIAQVFMEKVKSIYNIENIQVVDEAEISNEPSNINYKRDVALYIIAGLVVSVFYILIENMLDTTIKSAEDIENIYQVPVLASIPVYEREGKNKKKGGKR